MIEVHANRQAGARHALNASCMVRTDPNGPASKRQATDAAKQAADAQDSLEKSSEVPEEVVEEGRIYFLFRPKVSLLEFS